MLNFLKFNIRTLYQKTVIIPLTLTFKIIKSYKEQPPTKYTELPAYLRLPHHVKYMQNKHYAFVN